MRDGRRSCSAPRCANCVRTARWRPSHLLNAVGCHSTPQNNWRDEAAALIACGARLNSQNNAGETALVIACQNNSAGAAVLLARAGAAFVADKTGRNPLHFAAESGCLEVRGGAGERVCSCVSLR